MIKLFLTVVYLLFIDVCFSQWVEEKSDSPVKIDSIDYSKWNHIVEYGGIYLYCGLPSDNEKFTYVYYKQLANPEVIYFERMNDKDSSLVKGFYHLTNDSYTDTVVECWVPDLLWQYFDKNQTLIKQDFYSLGEIVNPQEFKLFPKSGTVNGFKL